MSDVSKGVSVRIDSYLLYLRAFILVHLLVFREDILAFRQVFSRFVLLVQIAQMTNFRSFQTTLLVYSDSAIGANCTLALLIRYVSIAARDTSR